MTPSNRPVRADPAPLLQGGRSQLRTQRHASAFPRRSTMSKRKHLTHQELQDAIQQFMQEGGMIA
ncbi:MAG: hypothetical protein O7D96_09860, partial [SAR324 cluster bacterium]|nr:hypothetical protein [SAR324 cluster bacterium]